MMIGKGRSIECLVEMRIMEWMMQSRGMGRGDEKARGGGEGSLNLK